MPEPVRRYYERERPIELRPVEFDRYLGKKIEDGRFQRLDPRDRPAAGRAGDPPMRARLRVRHGAARLRAVPHGRTVFEQTIMAASLDHALWFHRPFRADDWLLYAQDSPNLRGRARLLARPGLHARRHAGGVGRAGRACCASAAPAADVQRLDSILS